jgi:hypothetical protein
MVLQHFTLEHAKHLLAPTCRQLAASVRDGNVSSPISLQVAATYQRLFLKPLFARLHEQSLVRLVQNYTYVILGKRFFFEAFFFKPLFASLISCLYMSSPELRFR